ncbi:MAG TPA: hypothetical protein VFO95_07320 [Gemmatimonadales bacterium]|nr:hypothetical protein [Gemmatimonadales bacterium]
MTFKPAIWRPIAWILSAVNVGGIFFAMRVSDPPHALLHAVLAVGFGWWAIRLGRGSAGGELNRLQEQLEQQAVVLEDTQALLASQANQIAELHERIDFAERLLTQARDRAPSQAEPGRS